MRHLKALGAAAPPQDTPAQRFGRAHEEFVASYLKRHGGLDHMNVTKVVMQYAANVALDQDATQEEFEWAAGAIFREIEEAKRG